MAKWVTKELESLLKQINNVPFTDNRESLQLSILMKGFAELNSQAMDKAATKTREQFRNWELENSSDEAVESNGADDDAQADRKMDIRKGSIEEKIVESKKKPKNSASEALTKLRPIR